MLSRGAFGRGVPPGLVADHRPGPVAVDVLNPTGRGGLAFTNSTGLQDSTRNAEFVTNLYRRLLHREPDTQGLQLWVGRLDAGVVGQLDVATAFLISPEYAASHPDNASFVEGLYRDVLGRAPDRAGQLLWTSLLSRNIVDRARVAREFLASAESFLRAQPTSGLSFGQVVNVSVDRQPWSSGISGNVAQVGITYNNGDFQPRQVTISVNQAGTYVLDHSTSFAIINNTGRPWRGYTFAILPGSTAGPSFVSSSDLSGRLQQVDLTATSIRYSGGTVPSLISTPFLPRTTITTAGGGTIVIRETPVV